MGMDRAKRKFCIDRNLTDTGWYDKQEIGWLHQWYDAIAYTPQTNGVVYDLTHEAPEMFSFDDDDDNLVPQDRVWHDPDIDQLDLTAFENRDDMTIIEYKRLPYGTKRISHGK
jgi:hypothetical protein